ncbi:MAG: MYXO-CTERM sorting domain-containing protein [Myxococcota bacterium]|nr:MYXO-CTERM sorting domain-containing protein [Myxococcota bacterium]
MSLLALALSVPALAAPNANVVLGANNADDEPLGDFTPTGNVSTSATYDFYPDVSGAQLEQSFILRNDGDEDLTLDAPQIWDDQELTVSLGDCEGLSVLAAGERCTFTVTLLADAALPGSYSGRLEVETNDPDAEVFSFEAVFEKPADGSGCSSAPNAGWGLWVLALGLLGWRRRQS